MTCYSVTSWFDVIWWRDVRRSLVPASWYMKGITLSTPSGGSASQGQVSGPNYSMFPKTVRVNCFKYDRPECICQMTGSNRFWPFPDVSCWFAAWVWTWSLEIHLDPPALHARQSQEDCTRWTWSLLRRFTCYCRFISTTDCDNSFRQIPTFGWDTIRRFHKNVSEMKRMAAWDLEDVLQVGISFPVLLSRSVLLILTGT